MAWPFFSMPGTVCSPTQANVLLQRIILFAARQGVPEWDLVAASAMSCMGNQCHGRHCEPAMTNEWRYFYVCQAHQRVMSLMAQPNPDPGQAMACLGEINHGGGGGSGSGPTLDPAVRAELRRLRRQLTAAFKKARNP